MKKNDFFKKKVSNKKKLVTLKKKELSFLHAHTHKRNKT